MEYTINLPYDCDVKLIEEEEKSRFIKATLESMRIRIRILERRYISKCRTKNRIKKIITKIKNINNK